MQAILQQRVVPPRELCPHAVQCVDDGWRAGQERAECRADDAAVIVHDVEAVGFQIRGQRVKGVEPHVAEE